MNKDINLIRIIDFELSSICNAVCPVCCRRNENGELENFEQTYWTLKEVKRVLDVDVIKNLELFSICGNFGDAMGNPEIVEIVKWIRTNNTSCSIDIRTNGGIGTKKQYRELAKLKVVIMFSIDGVDEKNNLYRVNTKWSKINENLLEFTSNAESWQTNIQFLLWNENFDQLLPLIEYLKDKNYDSLYLRKPSIRGDKTEVFDIKGKSSHFLTEVKDCDDIMETWWKKSIINHLKHKIELLNRPIVELIKSDYKFRKKSDTFFGNKRNDYKPIKFEFSKEEKLKMSCKNQTCYSKNDYSIFISYDKYIMPCCLISLFINNSMYYSTGWENNYQKEILNKISDLGGMEKFSLKDKTLKEVFESGILHDLVYDNLDKGVAFGQCKLNCGKNNI